MSVKSHLNYIWLIFQLHSNNIYVVIHTQQQYFHVFYYHFLTGWEAIMKVCPDIFVDTSGYAFTLPLFKILGNCLVGCYIHYPTISTDMLSQVKSRASTYNNRSRISNSWFLSYLKLQYYKVIIKKWRDYFYHDFIIEWGFYCIN